MAGEEVEVRELQNGDVFCEDDNEHIGTYEPIAVESIPIELSIYYKGHLFFYKLYKKEKYTNEARNEERSGQDMSGTITKIEDLHRFDPTDD